MIGKKRMLNKEKVERRKDEEEERYIKTEEKDKEGGIKWYIYEVRQRGWKRSEESVGE